MRRKTERILLLALFAVLTACSTKTEYRVGESYNGFTLVNKQFVDEVNAECYLFEHNKSGARLLKIAADDPNKLFNIEFKTAPMNDYGTPHIMEHSVLNGSKNFPVKSPFDVLAKGSLHTFLNAMTGADITTYPVASMNDKDYFNLMHVYLDAVFHPLIYEDPFIFKQEGWHYELDSTGGDIVYKGVVYNEMKGAYSSPRRELGYQINKMLFPDNTYGVSSGGYPTEIPKLTYEAFLDFHRTFYHPSNSYILLYGDADLNKELAFIDTAYLSKYDRSDKKIEIQLQKPFKAMKEAEKPYAVPEGSPTKDQTFLSLSFVAGQSTDRVLSMTFDVLTDALVNNESAPVRLALQEAGIGRDVRASYNEAKQNVFQIIVQNANPEDKDRFKEIVFNEMKKTADEGFDENTIEGILNRMEFNLKEGNTPQKGLMYLSQSYQSWFFADDPFLGLKFNAPLEKVKEGVNSGLLQNTITSSLLNNPHALLMVLKPEPGLQTKIDNATKAELAAYKKSLTNAEEEEIIQQTKELIEKQKSEDSPEALATIPMLKRSDISRDIEWYDIKKSDVAGVNVLQYEDFTNNIIYSNLYFDMRTLPQELIPYARLLTSLLGKLNTENLTYGELDNELNINTGGFNVYLNGYLEGQSDDHLIPKFVVTSKAITSKADKMYSLTDEIINHSKLGDKDRLKDLINRQHARIDSDVKNNGMSYAMTRLRSYYSNYGMFNEETSGIDYYRFITDASENFDAKSDEIIANLQKTADLLFTKNNLIAAVTCGKEDFASYTKAMETFAGMLKEGDAGYQNWKFDFQKKNEGLKTASKVQYVIKGYDFKKLGYEYNGKMRVLNQVLSTDWLQNQVRVIGGAYGGFAGISPSGNMYFASYRDPNLKETIENYNNTPGYLDNFEADDETMTRYIIGTISRMDRPMTPSQKGYQAVQYYFEKTTPEELKKERAEVLSTTAGDIQGMEQMVRDILKQDAICVYGNEGKVQDNAALFKSIVDLSN